MTAETTTPRSRRAILGAGVGAVVATVATTLARPLAVRATDGDFVHVGNTYSASTVTGFDTTTMPGVNALFGASGSGDGVDGSSDSGAGVDGSSNTGAGVIGSSFSDAGVYGFNLASNKSAILGVSYASSTGVQGYSGSGTTPTPPAKTGVYGYAAQDANASGVMGSTTLGRGVFGVASAGLGVYGWAINGNGVRGYAKTGAAGWFSTSGPKIGVAVRAIGKVTLDNCAGVATIASGTNSVTVTPGTDLVATSAVVATLMGSAGGATTVQRVIVNVTADTFTIYLTANATAAVTVAWLAFG